MLNWTWGAGLLLALSMASGAAADDPKGCWHLLDRCGPPWCGCHNDYCHKPLPAPPPKPTCCHPNDYCVKPLPPAPPRAHGCVDDYDGKPLPRWLPLCTGPGWTCGPPERCHAPR